MTEAAESNEKATPARQVDKVQMTDGRTVEFVGKRKMLKEASVADGQLPSVRFDFRNGNTINFQVPDGLLNKFAAHGAAQKIGDETAGEDDVDDMQIAVETIIERLSNGEWEKVREGGGGFGGTSILALAIVEVSGKPLEAVRAWLKTKNKAEKDAMRASPKFKPVVDRLESEKISKAAHVDTDALLADLDAVA